MSKTYGLQFKEALACKIEKEAEKWLLNEIEEIFKDPRCEYNTIGCNPVLAKEKIKKMILSNLGYMAGYYNHDTAQKIGRLFGAVHPIFGSSTYHKDMKPDECFNKGKEYAKHLAKE